MVLNVWKGDKKVGLGGILRWVMWGCGGIFLVSGFLLAQQVQKNYSHAEAFREMAGRFYENEISKAAGQEEKGQEWSVRHWEQRKAEEDSSGEMFAEAQRWRIWWEQAAEVRFPVYQSLAEENPDMIGWVRIVGTVLDYPVMYAPDRPDYYLHRDFQGSKSSYGTPYLEEACQPEAADGSLLIYGHHMRDGGMFASLNKYKEQEYFMQHPYIQFDTLEEAGSYEIAAVVKLDGEGTLVPWESLLFPYSEETFGQAWEIFRQKRFYDTGVELEWEDKLLALVTCEYTMPDGRLMVVARKIREESKNLVTAGYFYGFLHAAVEVPNGSENSAKS